MTNKEAENIACQIETMIMGVSVRPDSMTLTPNIVVAIEYRDNYPYRYVISDYKGTKSVDARSLTCE